MEYLLVIMLGCSWSGPLEIRCDCMLPLNWNEFDSAGIKHMFPMNEFMKTAVVKLWCNIGEMNAIEGEVSAVCYGIKKVHTHSLTHLMGSPVCHAVLAGCRCSSRSVPWPPAASPAPLQRTQHKHDDHIIPMAEQGAIQTGRYSGRCRRQNINWHSSTLFQMPNTRSHCLPLPLSPLISKRNLSNYTSRLMVIACHFQSWWLHVVSLRHLHEFKFFTARSHI